MIALIIYSEKYLQIIVFDCFHLKVALRLFSKSINYFIMQNRNPNEAVCMLTRNNQLVLSEIMLLEAANNYTVFSLSTGKKVVASSTLKRFEEEFPKNHFLRINKSMMLNWGSNTLQLFTCLWRSKSLRTIYRRS